MAKRKFNKNKIIKLTAKQIEISIADYFCPRRNLVVPNVYWGLNFVYELDILVVTQSNYAYEIEIKTTISDIKADKKKRKEAHQDKRIKELYFAIPYYLKEKAMGLIPERAGVLGVKSSNNKLSVIPIRVAKINTEARKIDDKERMKLGKLSAMRIWNLKKKLLKIGGLK